MAGGIGTVPTAEVMITNISTHVFVRLVGLLVMVLQSILVNFKLVNFTGPVIASGVMDDGQYLVHGFIQKENWILVKQLKTKWYEN